MTPATLPGSPIDGLRVIELTAGDAPVLQRFFEANPRLAFDRFNCPPTSRPPA